VPTLSNSAACDVRPPQMSPCVLEALGLVLPGPAEVATRYKTRYRWLHSGYTGQKRKNPTGKSWAKSLSYTVGRE